MSNEKWEKYRNTILYKRKLKYLNNESYRNGLLIAVQKRKFLNRFFKQMEVFYEQNNDNS